MPSIKEKNNPLTINANNDYCDIDREFCAVLLARCAGEILNLDSQFIRVKLYVGKSLVKKTGG